LQDIAPGVLHVDRDVACSPTLTVCGVAVFATWAFDTGSIGAVTQLGSDAVAFATRSPSANLTVQVTAWDVLTPRTVNTLLKNPGWNMSG
jgi:hypothetical protein